MSTPKRRAAVTQYAPVIVMPTNTPAEVVSRVVGAGYVPVLVDDISQVKLLMPSSDVMGSDMLMSSLLAICKTGSGACERFTVELFRRMVEREGKQP